MGKHNLWGLNDTEQAVLDRIAEGRGSEEDIKLLEGIIDKVHAASITMQHTILVGASTRGKYIN